MQEILAAWGSYATSLDALVSQWGKPILITEIGYRSVKGMSMHPWDYNATGSVDLQEQANAYEGCFETVWGRPWFRGLFAWYWSTNPNEGGAADTQFFIKDKPAQKVIVSWFSKT